MSGRSLEEALREIPRRVRGDERLEPAFARGVGEEFRQRRLIVDQQQARLRHSTILSPRRGRTLLQRISSNR